MKSDLHLNPETTLNNLVEQYNHTLSSLLEQHAPKKSKTTPSRSPAPWYSSNIKEAKILCRRAERKWRKTHLTVDFELYRSAYVKLRKMCTSAKQAYFQQKIIDCSGNQKSLYSMANRLMFKKRSSALPSHTNSENLAQTFSRYFDEKIVKIRSDIRTSQSLDTSDNNPSVALQPPIIDSFDPITEDEMKELISGSNSKHCTLDPIPTSLLKNCLDSLLPIICKIVNMSLETSRVPENFKQAIVCPLIKKPSLDNENMKNYRPVSNLPYVSKLLEKIVMTQFNTHLDNHGLREPLQSAYLAKHSTETALIKVFNDILCAIDNQQCVLLVLLDLSAAFDTIDHEIMLSRLEELFGVSGTALSWLKSYFSGRSQKIVLNESSSTAVPLPTGVPQGSVAGPGTFTAYTQPIGSIARKHGVSLHLYADDTQLYVGCHLKDQDLTKQRLESCVDEVRNWMANNMLKLNDNKTEYMIIGSRHALNNINENIKTINIGKESIKMSSSARNIGVYMDSTLSMDEHVAHICRACYVGIRDISKIRKFLTEEATTQLIIAFVTSKLDCNNALLYKCNKYLLEKLQLVQNNAARVISRRQKHDSIVHIRKQLHWLPIESRIEYKINLTTFKCLNNSAPSYLCNLLTPHDPGRPDLRSAEKDLLKKHRTRTVAGDRAFSNAAPALWNTLPDELREIQNLLHFKTALKTHLFNKAFPKN